MRSSAATGLVGWLRGRGCAPASRRSYRRQQHRHARLRARPAGRPSPGNWTTEHSAWAAGGSCSASPDHAAGGEGRRRPAAPARPAAPVLHDRVHEISCSLVWMVDGNERDRGQHGQQRQHRGCARGSRTRCARRTPASTASAAVGWCAAGRAVRRRTRAGGQRRGHRPAPDPSPINPVSAASCRYSWCTKRASTGTPRVVEVSQVEPAGPDPGERRGRRTGPTPRGRDPPAPGEAALSRASPSAVRRPSVPTAGSPAPDHRPIAGRRAAAVVASASTSSATAPSQPGQRRAAGSGSDGLRAATAAGRRTRWPPPAAPTSCPVSRRRRVGAVAATDRARRPARAHRPGSSWSPSPSSSTGQHQPGQQPPGLGQHGQRHQDRRSPAAPPWRWRRSASTPPATARLDGQGQRRPVQHHPGPARRRDHEADRDAPPPCQQSPSRRRLSPTGRPSRAGRRDEPPPASRPRASVRPAAERWPRLAKPSQAASASEQVEPERVGARSTSATSMRQQSPTRAGSRTAPR